MTLTTEATRSLVPSTPPPPARPLAAESARGAWVTKRGDDDLVTPTTRTHTRRRPRTRPAVAPIRREAQQQVHHRGRPFAPTRQPALSTRLTHAPRKGCGSPEVHPGRAQLVNLVSSHVSSHCFARLLTPPPPVLHPPTPADSAFGQLLASLLHALCFFAQPPPVAHPPTRYSSLDLARADG